MKGEGLDALILSPTEDGGDRDAKLHLLRKLTGALGIPLKESEANEALDAFEALVGECNEPPAEPDSDEG